MHAPLQENVTRLLHAVQAGDQKALNDLFPLVYEELRAQAHGQRRQWHGNNTINTTAMVHEAYLKLVNQTHVQWKSRAHFLSVAAKAMRHILIDYARRSQRQKRGGGHHKVSLQSVKEGVMAESGLEEVVSERAQALVALDNALNQLSQLSERQCQVVECRFFGGMTVPDTAAALGISPATVKRDWGLARAWLYREMGEVTRGYAD